MENRANPSTSIALIGPVLPYRGGIAQHTTMLHRALRTRSNLLTISFQRQYPCSLYPGTCDRDPGYQRHIEPGVLYVLDSLNPLTWTKTCRIIMDHCPKLILFIWGTFFGAPYYGYMARYFRKKGIKVLFLCHNAIDHESAFWKAAIGRMALSQSDNFLVHTKSEKDRLLRMNPDSNIFVHPHPVYNHFPTATQKRSRRARLELLFFGFVRHYKGIDVLLSAMQLLEDEDIFLTVAGEWWEKDKKLKKMLKDERCRNNVEVIDYYLSEKEVAECFCRADVVILPYRSATCTGVIPVAYHYGKPVIASRTGGIPEVVIDGVSGRLFEPENPQALAAVIREFLHSPAARMREGVRKVAATMTWDSLAECILRRGTKSPRH